MITKSYKGPERRQNIRIEHVTPVNYKICKRKTLSTLMKGYSTNVSKAGMLCNLKERVKKDDIIWLGFDRGTLSICGDIEKNAFIYQNGVIAKVVRVISSNKGAYEVGVNFITREEKNSSNIYPLVHFIKDGDEKISHIEMSEEEVEGEESIDTDKETDENKTEDLNNEEEKKNPFED